MPVATFIPPDKDVYQSTTSPLAPGAAESVTVPAPQMVAPVTDVGTPGYTLIVAVTGVLVAETQPVAVFLACA